MANVWWWPLLLLYAVITSVFVFASLRVASDADDAAERAYREWIQRGTAPKPDQGG